MSRLHRFCTAALILTMPAAFHTGSVRAEGPPKPAVRHMEVDASRFGRSEIIDHPYWPLKPGTEMVYEGTTTDEDGTKSAHKLVMTVTDLVQVMAGIRTRVILELDYSDGKIIEKELAYLAQDKDGNVWHIGEYRETYDEEFVGGRMFYQDNPPGAKAGWLLPAVLQPGTPSYSQGFCPLPSRWTDRGRVGQIGQKLKGALRSYDDVVVIDEFDAETPKEIQLKYYAKGVGNVKIDFKGEGGVGETMDLTKVTTLAAKDMDVVRETCIGMDRRGRVFNGLPKIEKSAPTE